MAGTVTIWTQAVTAIMAALNAPGKPATFYRNRFEAVGATETAGNLFRTKIDCKYDCDQRAVRLDDAIVVRVDTASPPASNVSQQMPIDVAVDPIIQWAWRQIRFDPTLAAWNNGVPLVEDVYIDYIEFGYVDKSASDQISADIAFRIEVEVGRNDPSINMTYGAQL